MLGIVRLFFSEKNLKVIIQLFLSAKPSMLIRNTNKIDSNNSSKEKKIFSFAKVTIIRLAM